MARLLSAIISNFNHGAYVGDAVESVLANADPDVECIVVDDGSTDQSREVLARYSADPRVKVVLKENGGQASAFNAGFEVAQGEIIALFDGDDFWFPFKVRTLRERIAEHDLMGRRWYLRHPLTRVFDQPSTQAAEAAKFTRFHDSIPTPQGTMKRIISPDEFRSELRRYRFPVAIAGDFGGSSVASRSAMELIFPLPEGISKHFGDMFPVLAAPIVAELYGLMLHLGVYRMHGANHSLTRPREPYAFWKGIEAYTNEVLQRVGEEPVCDFDASPFSRRYLMEQGRIGDAVGAFADRARRGLPNHGLKQWAITYAMAARFRMKGAIG